MHKIRIGIDASNARAGGGLTYLSELLTAASPASFGVAGVTVWAGRNTLRVLPHRPWLTAAHDALLDGGLPQRLYWQYAMLDRAAAAQCDMLFIPGGTYFGSALPYVTMSQNLLPFDGKELARFGASWSGLRLRTLAVTQKRTLRCAQGVIFLTEAASDTVQASIGALECPTTIIPHGISPTFSHEPRPQLPLSRFSTSRPFRWLYVSIVHHYKHQWNVVQAAAEVRARGLPIHLDLVGPAYRPALLRLERAIEQHDPKGEFVKYHGPVAYGALPSLYQAADAFVFASTCENMPIILLESMGAGLPVLCSERAVMREVLADAGLYIDPEDVSSIAAGMSQLMSDPALRNRLAQRAFTLASRYRWEQTAAETFSFLARICRSQHTRV